MLDLTTEEGKHRERIMSAMAHVHVGAFDFVRSLPVEIHDLDWIIDKIKDIDK